MKILVDGHRYELAHDNVLQFIQKFTGGPEVPGTTNEEVLAVLIDRLCFLNAKYSCRENALAITKLEEALMWLAKRTANRAARGVEGKDLA